jgi:hypothetical protein
MRILRAPAASSEIPKPTAHGHEVSGQKQSRLNEMQRASEIAMAQDRVSL